MYPPLTPQNAKWWLGYGVHGDTLDEIRRIFAGTDQECSHCREEREIREGKRAREERQYCDGVNWDGSPCTCPDCFPSAYHSETCTGNCCVRYANGYYYNRNAREAQQDEEHQLDREYLLQEV